MKPRCAWCGLREATHRHHLVFRSRDPSRVADPTNLVWLCLVCHDAAHWRRTTFNGFSCRVCPLFAECDAGQRTYG